jgi:hypothetical protein
VGEGVGMGVVDRGVVDGLVELDTKPDTGINLDFECLILALNLLSMVNLRLRLDVFIGVLLLDKFRREFTKEFPPKVH